jgi:hypothetical protein
MKNDRVLSNVLVWVTPESDELLPLRNCIGPNSLASSAFVRVSDASPVTGGPPSIPSSVVSFVLRDSSNLSVTQTSQVSGNLNCAAGANAFCINPGNVSGTSNCFSLPKTVM